jgi:flagellar assembly protein FliH
MTAAGKFTFDRDFGRRGAAPLAPSPDEEARAQQEARARAAGLAEGRAQGRAEAQAELDQRMAEALDAIAARMGDTLARIETIEAAAADDAARFALRFAEALAGAALKRFPLAALEAAAREVFAQVRQAPHCVIRLNAALVDQATALTERIARLHGFEGRVIVMGETDVAAGDFLVEWADGGMARDGEATRRLMLEAIERHVGAAQGGTNGEQP